MTIVARALKFRAKPIEFEAVLFDGSNAEDVIDIFANMLPDPTNLSGRFRSPPRKAQGSPTRARAFGVFYPLKPDLFEKKFEPVEPFGHEEAQPSSA